jgi:hypothetical protein
MDQVTSVPGCCGGSQYCSLGNVWLSADVIPTFFPVCLSAAVVTITEGCGDLSAS